MGNRLVRPLARIAFRIGAGVPAATQIAGLMADSSGIFARLFTKDVDVVGLAPSVRVPHEKHSGLCVSIRCIVMGKTQRPKGRALVSNGPAIDPSQEGVNWIGSIPAEFLEKVPTRPRSSMRENLSYIPDSKFRLSPFEWRCGLNPARGYGEFRYWNLELFL